LDGWLRLAFVKQSSLVSIIARNLLEAQGKEGRASLCRGIFSENFRKLDVIVDVIVEQIWLMERLSAWMVRLLERLSA